LSLKAYAKLLEEATIITHPAWQVDFNLTTSSFEPQIAGVRNLLDFSANSSQKAPLIFVSSISTALGLLDEKPNVKIPEEIIHDFNAPAALGYGESKFVSELLLDKFCKTTRIISAVFRTGQIAGPLRGKGIWNKQE
jgi:thioester reductase-like protein